VTGDDGTAPQDADARAVGRLIAGFRETANSIQDGQAFGFLGFLGTSGVWRSQSAAAVRDPGTATGARGRGVLCAVARHGDDGRAWQECSVVASPNSWIPSRRPCGSTGRLGPKRS